MICQNCGRREANVKYTQIINGVKKEINVCEECARELGIESTTFSMPLSFSSILGDMFAGVLSNNTMPEYMRTKNSCIECGTDMDLLLDTGLLGCPECYETLGDKLDTILKRVQGADRHTGHRGKNISKTILNNEEINTEKEEKVKENIVKDNIVKKDEPESKENKINRLEKDLEKAIKEERYEDAAKIRDEINSMKSEDKE